MPLAEAKQSTITWIEGEWQIKLKWRAEGKELWGWHCITSSVTHKETISLYKIECPK